MTSKTPLLIGTRGSPLALAQARMALAALAERDPALAEPGAAEIRVIKTTGDSIQDRPLTEIGGKGLFTKELQEALYAREIDIAVHSMKDVATVLPDGLTIGCMLPREDPRDVLLARGVTSLGGLPQGAVVGTASLRRAAQLLALRPDLRVVTLRGNVQRRLARLESGEIDATMLAMAGLLRLQMGTAGGTPLEPEEMLPAPAQGAIGIEHRADDADVAERLAAISHAPTFARVTTERAFLRVLDGSCRTPIAALATFEGERLRLRGLVAKPDGSRVEQVESWGAAGEAQELGERAGADVRARLGNHYPSGWL
ncbi:hydroxymethylbilane synthase [Geminicoccaceae bacterium 1502E]|nr:hydroxymethylbilane synthase [Geminicoccaceae bacterium 1502E]